MIYSIEPSKDLWLIPNWFITVTSFVLLMSQEIGKNYWSHWNKRCVMFRCRPDNNVTTISMEEKDRFNEIKERLKSFLEYQVTNFRLGVLFFVRKRKHLQHCWNHFFRFAFPFGRPEGALKATLSLLERVLAKDIATPISRDDIRNFIRKCLENAAYINYTRVSDQAKIEGKRKSRKTKGKWKVNSNHITSHTSPNSSKG